MTQQLDIIELLERDHELIDGLAEQLDASEDPVEIRHLFMRLVEELAAHEAAEQEVAFPAFRSTFEGTADKTLLHRMGEHEELNELVAEMRGLAPDGYAFIKRGSALLLEVKRHFQLEEETVFARLRVALAPDQLAALATAALAAKQHAPAFPSEHPQLAL